MELPTQSICENEELRSRGRATRGASTPPWDTPASRWRAAPSAEVVLGDKPVKGLAVDAGGLGRRRDVTVVTIEEIGEIVALEYGHPALAGLGEGQTLRRPQPGIASGGVGSARRPETLAREDVVGKVAALDHVPVGQRARAFHHVL